MLEQVNGDRDFKVPYSLSPNGDLVKAVLGLQIHTTQGADGTPTMHAVQALAEVATGQGDGLAVDLNNVTEATLNQEGQIILTGEDGHGNI